MLQTIVGFHASPHRFERPDYAMIRANRVNHANGHLGLWVASGDNAWVRKFGGHLYRLELEGRVQDLPIETLSRWSREEPGWYGTQRKQLLDEGVAYLRVVEQDGRSDMGIVIDLDAICRFEIVSEPDNTSAARRPLPDTMEPGM